MKRTLTIVVAAALVASLALPAVVHAESGTVAVTVSVLKHVQVAEVDGDTVAIRANTDWTLVVDTTDGLLELTGRKTGETPAQVDLPENTVSYWVVTN